MSESSKAGGVTKWLKTINPFLAFLGIGGLIPVISWIWSAVNPIGTLDLTVLIEEESFIALPLDVDSVPLNLVYGEEHFRSALIFDAVITNTGSRPLGADERWRLTLQHPDDLKLMRLSKVATEPTTITDDVSVSTSNGRIVFDLGLLNPDDQVRIRLMAAEHPNEFRLPVVAHPSRIEGLSRVAVERGSALKAVHSRVANRIILPMLVIWLVVIAIVVIREQLRKVPTDRMGLKELTVVVVIFVPLSTILLAWVSTWILAWVGVLASKAG